MTLSDIIIYPIKSCSGIALSRHAIVPTGFAYDRRWMLVDSAGQFISQRTVPAMARLRIALREDRLVVTAPDSAPLEVPFDVPNPLRMAVSIWQDAVEALVYPERFGAWFANILRAPCRLVLIPDDEVRPVDPRYAADGDRVGFADAYPFLLLSEGSLQDLNGRLTRPVPMNRFRPNLVVTGTEPYAEDRWKRIRIGGMEFRIVKPCARCTVPGVDQETGVAEKEVLSVLASYRTVGHKVLFGQNVIHDSAGVLETGMPVEILEEVR
jgi:uncharacterized protein YcbX